MLHSLRCLAVIGSVLGRAGETGHERRIRDAKRGIVAWNTPLDVAKFMWQERARAEYESAAAAEAARGRAYLSEEDEAGFDTGFQQSHSTGARSNPGLD